MSPESTSNPWISLRLTIPRALPGPFIFVKSGDGPLLRFAGMNPSLKLGIAVGAMATLLGCGPAVGDSDEPVRTTASPTFEQWKAALPIDDTGTYIVEGDVPVIDEARLPEFYERAYNPQALTVHNPWSSHDVWPFRLRYDLTYCVSDDFLANKPAVVAGMQAATAAWHDVAEIRYVYLPQHDAKCDAFNSDVLFNVRPGSCGPKCGARAFLPSFPRVKREIIVTPTALAPPPQYTLTGVLRHELGHTLGFAHEHIWYGGCDDAETADSLPVAERITDWDRNSVMYYDFCPNATQSGAFELSVFDALGAACEYNSGMGMGACDGYARRSNDAIWWSKGLIRQFDSSSVVADGLSHPISGDFDGDGASDVFWYGRGPEPDRIWWADGDKTFTSASTAVHGRYVTLSGDFDGDGNDDIFWYGATSQRTDYVWWGSSKRKFDSTPFTVNGRYVPVAGDFDGDGRSDIFWYAPGETSYIWWGNSGREFTSETIDNEVWSHFRPFAGDFDGDGRSDVLLYAAGTLGSDAIWYGRADRAFDKDYWNITGDYQPVIGDFDGLFGDDILWYGPGDSAPDYMWWSKGNRGFTSNTWTVDGHYVPIVGDFNGDNGDDIFWYAPHGNGDWSYCNDDNPCAIGQGDCDSDADCSAPFTCVHNVGADYGWPASVDVCE